MTFVLSPEHWQKVKAILGSALELAPEAREPYVAVACAEDTELGEEVRRFLSAYGRDSAFIEEPAWTEVALPAAGLGNGSLGTGSRIGPYVLGRHLGSGGMGDVFEAEQQFPVRRIVALKLIRLGLDSRQVVARFEAERQALALMSHPNVAHVFDAGTSEQGRPYFAMECIRGPTITEYCDAEELGVRQRVELLIDVCRGVHHAHQRGIIHRDLKPANVLVAVEDGRAVAKIIDFGVAKCIAQPMAEGTLFTERGQWLGTPEYMSPEQACLGAARVDTRTDVYSLGALLYELLVGVQPFDPRELRRAGFETMLHTLRQVDPSMPSARVHLIGDAAPRIAANRGLDPARLERRLRGELDWITMKALDKNPDGRYSSGADLAADLRRHLSDEPILAGPLTTRYRLRKLLRRHRWGAVACGLVLLSLAVGIVGISLALVRARGAEVQAREQAEAALVEADRANREAATAEQVTNFLLQVFQASDPMLAPRADITLREILDRSAERVREELEDQPIVKARLMDTIASTYRSLGVHPPARMLYEEALAIRVRELGEDHLDVAQTQHGLSRLFYSIGDYPASRRLLERSIALKEAHHGPSHPAVADGLTTLGILLKNLGEYDAAIEVYERTVDIRQRELGEHPDLASTLVNLGFLFFECGDLVQARAVLQRGVGILEEAYGPRHAQLSPGLTNLGMVEESEGNHDVAYELFERALEIDREAYGPEHPYVAGGMMNLAALALERGDCTSAIRLQERALPILSASLHANHGWQSQIELARAATREQCAR